MDTANRTPDEVADLHVPVLQARCVELLAPALTQPGAVVIDATLGMGGHTAALLAALPNCRVVGIDRDPQAIALATQRLAPYADRFIAVQATYDTIDDVAARHGRGGQVDGILMDLGVSSLQLDDAERGFSYVRDAELDMRMSDTGPTAAQLLASASEVELRRILRVYGEEKFAPQIAKRIVDQRQQRPLRRTSELAELVKTVIPAPARRTGGNPAKRTFQALRIAVNDELRILEAALPRAIASLAVGGRIVVESYHSLEDRLVKVALAAGANPPAPVGLPVLLPEHEPYLRLLTRGAERADAAEIANNSRSQSVRLRAAERIRSANVRSKR
ncbi:16S rRNA (cytosine(1402)-N(4))-methyltransferase RsmH [Buchananella hordeovulneris]|uniref:Ribosomal RNA small subunit methyltransferase H n=1 Tax=Buchananella hordeovulneris TaxID=52770 RepID=A0A1Q5PVS5_9ACTO|nr:16S rRNA (cytosine(1402)-N(4))-methyltransferase RsmH [Buchananella hordeovulneris]OKL51535.1 16S rRNA (cytosine(1402)-N(4))-methyltransferase [Buchananella hordeovulneris]